MVLRRLAAGAAVVLAGLAMASGAPAQERVAPLAEGEAWVFMPTPGIFDRDDFPRFASSEEAQRLVARIMGTVGLAPRFEVYAGPVGTAAARIEDGGVRVIYYSESWVQQTIAKDEWMAVALLAHEVGHHLNNHTLQRLEDRPLQELEADKFAGFVVGKLGGTLADALRLYETLPQKGGRSHPGRADRLEAVAVGWREGARAPAPPVVAAPAIPTTPGARFREPGCPQCPEMVVVPSGSFMMGSPSDEPQRGTDEGPRQRVSIKSFAIGVYEVTFDEWAACVTDGFCTSNPSPDDRGWDKANRPVINVSWDDITGQRGFIDWLNSKTTGAPYRLPSEAEWEFAARAGSDTPFWWGRTITPEQANYDGNYPYNGGPKGEYRQKTLPVRSFEPNKFGLYQVHGNVWEWVQDCWNESLDGQPADGSARRAGDCSLFVRRGGSWGFNAHWLRSANRDRGPRFERFDEFGFRVARTAVK